MLSLRIAKRGWHDWVLGSDACVQVLLDLAQSSVPRALYALYKVRQLTANVARERTMHSNYERFYQGQFCGASLSYAQRLHPESFVPRSYGRAAESKLGSLYFSSFPPRNLRYLTLGTAILIERNFMPTPYAL